MQLGKGGCWLSGASCVFLPRKDVAFKLLWRQPKATVPNFGYSSRPFYQETLFFSLLAVPAASGV